MLGKILVLMLALSSMLANALKIEINRGQISPDPIAIMDFYGDGGANSQVGKEISEIIKTDLELSGLFTPIDSKTFLENKQALSENGPNIKNWKVLDARFLLYGKITEGWGSLSVDFALVDVVTGETILSLKVEEKKSRLRKAAHIIADYVYERITGEKGYFNTTIVYVETSDNRNSSKRKTRLVRVDQDGFNRKTLTNGEDLVLTPRHSRNSEMLAYISYSDEKRGILGKSAHVYMMNSNSGRRKLMIDKKLMEMLIKKNHGNPVRMTYAPRFSPNGENAVLAIIIDGKSAIYKINFATNQLTQLTEHKCIDTSPCFSNDGERIVFTSNRHGKEAIYIMGADGSNQQKISGPEGKYSQPVWSPRSDLIAFSKQVGGQFFIGVMKTDGSGERLIVTQYLAEAPSWASNGRYLAYSGKIGPKNKVTMFVVDITGHHIRIIPTEKDASYPDWSPIAVSD